MDLELKVTAKGQVTLRKAVLHHLNARPGTTVSVALLSEGRVELQAAASPLPVSRLRGALRRPGHAAISLAEMQDAIERGGGR